MTFLYPVSALCSALMKHCICVQSVLAGEELNKLSVAEGSSLADQVALAIGQ